MTARERERHLWRRLVKTYEPTCFAVAPTGARNPEQVEHLFSSGRIALGNCRWWAFESEEQRERFLLDVPDARSCGDPVKNA